MPSKAQIQAEREADAHKVAARALREGGMLARADQVVTAVATGGALSARLNIRLPRV